MRPDPKSRKTPAMGVSRCEAGRSPLGGDPIGRISGPDEIEERQWERFDFQCPALSQKV